MSTLREAAQQALEALEATHYDVGSAEKQRLQVMDAITALRAALAQQEPMRPTFQEMQNAAANLRVMKEMFGDPAASCDIAEDGVCEAIDCCRNRSQILEALEIGYDSAQAEAAQYHAAMAGYRPERHAAMDADVAKIAAAITALRASLAQQAEPVAWLRRDELADLQTCNYRRLGADSPRIWAPHQSDSPDPALDLVAVFTAPPRREWRGLKEWEINDGRDQLPTEDLCNWSFRQGVYFAEKALKEKNA